MEYFWIEGKAEDAAVSQEMRCVMLTIRTKV